MCVLCAGAERYGRCNWRGAPDADEGHQAGGPGWSVLTNRSFTDSIGSSELVNFTDMEVKFDIKKVNDLYKIAVLLQ